VTTANPNPYKRALLRRERSLDTRRKLVRAAARLWSEKGYDVTTVEEICAAAGVGRTTYYLYFDSKEQLLLELTHATARGVASDVQEAGEAGTLDEQLHIFVDGLVRRMDSVPRSLAALTMRHAVAGIPRPRRPAGEIVLFDDTLTDILRDGQRRGEIRTDVDAREIGDILGGTTMDALQRWADDRARLSLRDSLELRIDLVLDSVRTRPDVHAGATRPRPRDSPGASERNHGCTGR
jgi:AcrR family transcriptional regulator